MAGFRVQGINNPENIMGCDIHMRAEFRKNKNSNWEMAGDLFKSTWYNPDMPKTDYNREFTNEPFESRNYDLFGILADVRNGRGFAGIKTGERFNPISEPKGIAGDSSQEFKDLSDAWASDGHSHSYLTVKELQDYDWDQERDGVKYKDHCGSFVTKTIPELLRLGSPENVRIVFFFDN